MNCFSFTLFLSFPVPFPSLSLRIPTHTHTHTLRVVSLILYKSDLSVCLKKKLEKKKPELLSLHPLLDKNEGCGG